MTQSWKAGLIAYLKVSRNDGFKYSVCCSLPMVEVRVPNFHTFYTNFLPSIVFNLMLTLPRDIQKGGRRGPEMGKGLFKKLKRKAY